MINALNEETISNLTRLKFTSFLADKEICRVFKISQNQLRQWKKEFADYANISDRDFVYGALRSLDKPNVDQIAKYVDYKNRTEMSNKIIKRALKKLIDEGLAYQDNARFNYSQRLIEIYSNKTDKFVDEVELGYFDLKKFKKLFRPKTWDNLMYEPQLDY